MKWILAPFHMYVVAQEQEHTIASNIDNIEAIFSLLDGT